MKKIWNILWMSACICSCLLLPVSAQEAFTIEDLHIHMSIQEDGSYLVSEEYTLNFTQQRHGFYRTIPTKYEMKWTDETGEIENRSYFFPISDIDCDTNFVKDTNGNGVMIRLGDEDQYVYGLQTYRITYRVQTKDLDYKDTQMVYWNLVGNSFDTTIKHMSYEIKMPKDFDESMISTYTGAYFSAFPNLSYEVNEHTITGELLEPLNNYESATIKIDLPSDYFQFPIPHDYLLYGAGTSILMLVISGLLFIKFGKDDEIVTTIEFRAPDGLDSAAVGFIVDNMVDNKDIISLLIDWANRGYISIHDNDHHMTLEKQKDMDKENTKYYERVFFDAIFAKKDIVDEEDLKAIEIGKGLRSAKAALSRYFSTAKRRVYTNSSVSLQILMAFILAIPAFVCSFAAFYMHYEMIELCFGSFIILIITALAGIPWFFLMRKRYVLKKSTYFLLWALCFAINIIMYTITMMIMLVYGNANAWIYVGIFAFCEIVMLFLMMFMDKRTPRGNIWLGQILGLREFILNCEKERLELLVNDTPSAFYDILPYAYVLGVSDVWSKKFEDLIVPAPSWYHSDTYHSDVFTTYLWWGYFSSSFRNMSNAATYIQPSKSSYGGHGGGSFGGFGGGGFSGGGFGGGGGGSW